MITHTHARARTSDHPSRSSCSTVVRAAGDAALARPQLHQERGRDEERRGVDREREPGPDAEHERGRERRPDELGDRLDGAERRPWPAGSGPPGPSAGRGRCRPGRKNASAVPKPASISAMCQISTVPVKISAASSACSAKRIRSVATITLVPRQPVGPHAADQQEADQRQRVGGEHDADVARRPELGHVQRERDEHDPVADRARRLPAQQQPEVPVSEHALHDTA